MDILKAKLFNTIYLQRFLKDRIPNYSPRSTIFSLYYAGELSKEDKIYISGDFNGWVEERCTWDKSRWQMSPVFQDENHYCLTTTLYPGLYQYKFRIEFKNKNEKWIPQLGFHNLACKIPSGNTPAVVFCYFSNGKLNDSLYLKSNFNGWGDNNPVPVSHTDVNSIIQLSIYLQVLPILCVSNTITEAGMDSGARR